MLKIILNDLFISLKRSWISIILNLIIFYFLSIYIATFIFVINMPEDMIRTENEIRRLLLDEEMLRIIIPYIYGIGVVILFNIIKKIPLRISKAMFVCATNEKEKMKYISLQLSIKIIIGFVFIFISKYIFIGKIFINQSILFDIIEIILWFFIILDINLKIGIGEQGLKKIDKEGYIIYSKEEEIVNYYWVCLLMLEAIIFYTIVALNIQLNFLVLIGWIIAFAINTYIAYYCVNPILRKSLSYEDVYRQIPDTKEG